MQQQSPMSGNSRQKKTNACINPLVRWVLGSTWEIYSFLCIAMRRTTSDDRIAHADKLQLGMHAGAYGKWKPIDSGGERRRDACCTLHSSISNKSKWLLFKVKFTFDPECLTQLYIVCKSHFELHVRYWRAWWHATCHLFVHILCRLPVCAISVCVVHAALHARSLFFDSVLNLTTSSLSP